MDRTKQIIAVTGLAIGVIFGLSGSIFGGPQGKIILYGISSLGLVAAGALLTLHYFRKNDDLVATGFLVFTIGEAIMMGGAPAGDVGGQPSFGAGMAMYVPALLMISASNRFALWNRLSGIAAAIPFLIASTIIFNGGEVFSSSGLAGAGYGLLSLTIIGWITTIWGTNKVESKSGALEGQMA